MISVYDGSDLGAVEKEDEGEAELVRGR